MSTEIITALIALLGIFLSVSLSYFSNKQILRSKIKELELEMLQQNSIGLYQKRLEFFPNIYFILSEMVKRLKKDIVRKQINDIDENVLQIFFEEYERANSKYGLFFSSQSAIISGKLRSYLLHLTESSDDLTILDLDVLKKIIGELELSLKQDAGIFIDELQSLKIGKSLREFSDVNKHSLKIQQLRKESSKFKKQFKQN